MLEQVLQASGVDALIARSGAALPAAGFRHAAPIFENLALARRETNIVAMPPGTAKVTFTSGSTGQPKGVCLTGRSEEHTSELQSLMRISYAVFCLKKKKH